MGNRNFTKTNEENGVRCNGMNTGQEERSTIISFDCFTQEQVKEINKKIKKNLIQKEEPDNVASSASKIGDFFIISCEPLIDLLHPWLYHCQQINRKDFGYDIYWDFHLETMNYNVYGTGGGYGWHIDRNYKGLEDMKLTCLLNLSEESYEGGEFQLFGVDEKINFTSGMGVVINSLIAHKVTPITKGERISLTYWGEGPTWR